jgi:hypothetical protein
MPSEIQKSNKLINDLNRSTFSPVIHDFPLSVRANAVSLKRIIRVHVTWIMILNIYTLLVPIIMSVSVPRCLQPTSYLLNPTNL